MTPWSEMEDRSSGLQSSGQRRRCYESSSDYCLNAGRRVSGRHLAHVFIPPGNHLCGFHPQTIEHFLADPIKRHPTATCQRRSRPKRSVGAKAAGTNRTSHAGRGRPPRPKARPQGYALACAPGQRRFDVAVRARELLAICVHPPSNANRHGHPPQLENIHAQLKALEKALRERGLAALAVFGSIARGTARFDSDVDVLINIAPYIGFSLVDLLSAKDFLAGVW